jgi:hypothetical protein
LDFYQEIWEKTIADWKHRKAQIAKTDPVWDRTAIYGETPETRQKSKMEKWLERSKDE